MIHHIAASKHAGHRSLGGAGLNLQIAVGIHSQLVLEQLGRRRMADGHERALGRLDRAFTRHRIGQRHAAEPRIAADKVIDRLVPQHLDMGVREQPVLQDLFRAQTIAAMDQGDVLRMVGQVQRFFNCGIAAADHHHLFAAIEKPVAGRAG